VTKPLFNVSSVNNRSFSSSQDIYVERLEAANEQGIYVLNLNRQPAKNALNANLINSLSDNVEKLKSVKDLKVLILASKVKGAFCAGADLKERLRMDEKDIDPFVVHLRSVAYQIYQFPAPTIAAIDGVALGGGLEMALACDLRICSTDARLGLVETSLAILPGAFGSQLLPRVVGLPKAKELIFAAKILSGDQAFEIGLVNEVLKQNDEHNAALLGSINLAKKIIPNGPIAVKAAKMAVNQSLETPLKDCLEVERTAYKKVIPTKDRVEGLRAFVEKRKPVYRGE